MSFEPFSSELPAANAKRAFSLNIRFAEFSKNVQEWGGRVQNAKDTFYEVLRARLASANPERVIVVRGVTRTGVVVPENELVQAQVPAECFVLRWGAVEVDTRGTMPTVTSTCEIGYATAGTALNGGMDRGRALAAMDEELLAVLTAEPRNAVKKSYSSSDAGTTATALRTRIWWGDAQFADSKPNNDRLTRTVRVPVMSLEEAGER